MTISSMLIVIAGSALLAYAIIGSSIILGVSIIVASVAGYKYRRGRSGRLVRVGEGPIKPLTKKQMKKAKKANKKIAKAEKKAKKVKSKDTLKEEIKVETKVEEPVKVDTVDAKKATKVKTFTTKEADKVETPHSPEFKDSEDFASWVLSPEKDKDLER